MRAMGRAPMVKMSRRMPAHPGGGPLIGLDGGGVVVALDPQRHGDAVAGVDDPGVLSRPHQDVGPLGREPFEVQP